MQKTSIQYLTHTWNPIKMRCTPVSSGCANCWHLRYTDRMKNNPQINEDIQAVYRGDKPPILVQEELEAPLHLRKPGRIGLQFMGDIFHKNIDNESLKDIFSIIRSCPQHTFLILTKRPQNINKKYFEYFGKTSYSHVWLGVSISTNNDLWMVETLLQIPATHRWISIEPMLAEVDLWPRVVTPNINDQWLHHIDWVVLGGETGPQARPMHPDWVRNIRDQCQAAEVPFFFKSWGDNVDLHPNSKPICIYGRLQLNQQNKHLLDGREWSEMP